MKEKILNFLKEFLFNKNYDMEKLDNELKELTEKIDNLYYSLNSDMSTYKTELYFYKHTLLVNKFCKYVKNYYKRVKYAYNKKIINSIIKNLIILVITNILTGNPLSLFFSIIGLYVSYESIVNCLDSLKLTMGKSEKQISDKETLLRLSNTLNNASNDIRNSFKKITENLEKTIRNSSDNIDDITYANNIILNYIYNTELITDLSLIPSNVKKLIIKILQDDLKTKEEDLEKLLDIAYKNVNDAKKININILKKEK